MDDDDDVPPPLSSLPEQIRALQVTSDGSQATAEQDADAGLPVATTTVAGARDRARPGPELKRGFFDAKPKAKAAVPKAAPPAASQTDGIPLLKGKKTGLAGPSIPDFLRVEPDEQTKKLQEMKGKLVSALQPTPETIAQLSNNPQLMAGFDDPVVMAAVDEISKDPSKANKYKDNKKVQAFYSAMAMFAGSQLESLGNKPL